MYPFYNKKIRRNGKILWAKLVCTAYCTKKERTASSSLAPLQCPFRSEQEQHGGPKDDAHIALLNTEKKKSATSGLGLTSSDTSGASLRPPEKASGR